jgi:hypothetical protein
MLAPEVAGKHGLNAAHFEKLLGLTSAPAKLGAKP